MSPTSARAARFVRALVSGANGHRDGDLFVAIGADGRRATLDAADVASLESNGVLEGRGQRVKAGAGARTWLRRALTEADGFAAQHRRIGRTATGTPVNLNESPLARLASPGTDGSPPFLAPHLVEAGERVRRLAERARMQPRLTMSYDATRVAGTRGSPADISDTAADARRQLSELFRILQADCAGAVLDVCGLLKGLQTVETERGWPRRSAKLVLRIGLEQLAAEYGLAPVAVGGQQGRTRSWIGENARPTTFE